MENKFWNCWVDGTSGGYHYKHTTFEDAKAEAERLARMPSNMGHKVYLMECISYCEVPEIPIEWTSILPF